MSKEYNAYEKMMKSGQAFKEVDMTQNFEPDLSEVTGNKVQKQIKEDKEPEREDDYTHFDSVMEERVQNLRNKLNGKTPKTPISEMDKLKKRIEKLEEALILIMETQTKLIDK